MWLHRYPRRNLLTCNTRISGACRRLVDLSGITTKTITTCNRVRDADERGNTLEKKRQRQDSTEADQHQVMATGGGGQGTRRHAIDHESCRRRRVRLLQLCDLAGPRLPSGVDSMGCSALFLLVISVAHVSQIKDPAAAVPSSGHEHLHTRLKILQAHKAQPTSMTQRDAFKPMLAATSP